VRRRAGIRAIASEQSLQQDDVCRFEQILIEPGFEAPLADGRIFMAAERDQVKLRRRKPLTHATRQIESVHPGHRDVEDAALGLECVGKRERARTIAGDGDFVTPAANQTGNRRSEIVMVVDDHHLPALLVGLHHGSAHSCDGCQVGPEALQAPSAFLPRSRSSETTDRPQKVCQHVPRTPPNAPAGQ